MQQQYAAGLLRQIDGRVLGSCVVLVSVGYSMGEEVLILCTAESKRLLGPCTDCCVVEIGQAIC
jgi:hypothetical protein